MQRTYEFGEFRLETAAGRLLRNGQPIALTPKVYDMLLVLVEKSGRLLSKDELMQALWPDTFVEESSLAQNISQLRRALGGTAGAPPIIETVAKRGYRFAASVRVAAESNADGATEVFGSSLPTTAPPVVGGVGGDHPLLHHWRVLAAVAALSVLGAALLRGSWTKSLSRAAVGDHSTPSRAKKAGGSGSSTTRSPRAYEEYDEARRLWRQRTSDSLAKAVEHYKRATDLDPAYAEAYAGLADCYIVMHMLSNVPASITYPKAQQAADTAVHLNDALGEAHLALAEVRLYSDWNFPGAEQEFQRALQLDPDSAQAHQWYAEFLSLMGRHQAAVAEIERAKQLDPTAMIIYFQSGQVLQAARQYEAALREYDYALQIQPGFGPTYGAMAIAYRRLGRFDDCIKASRIADRYWDPGGMLKRDLSRIYDGYARSGPRGFFEENVRFEKKRPGPHYYLAGYYALLGQREDALRALAASLAARESDFLESQNDPELDPLRDDPRFQEMIATAGLPPQSAGIQR